MTQMIVIATSIAGMILHAAGLRVHGSYSEAAAVGKEDLVFMHIPFNFGHTIELVHAYPNQNIFEMMTVHHIKPEGNGVPGVVFQDNTHTARLEASRIRTFRPNYQEWGHLHADLFSVSKVSGVPLYFTPQKHWPQEVAANYFGNKTVFGVLRDPYERLVAEFRGHDERYGGDNEFFADCDVNAAIKKMMREALNTTNPFAKNCAYVPQAEYFDGPYGIQLAIDNRRFPTSMNEAFEAHGYEDHITTENIMHVNGCNNVWARDLDDETRQMVRQVYKRDFELLCNHFGYCDHEENTCLREVPQMCPVKAFTWNVPQNRFVIKPSAFS